MMTNFANPNAYPVDGRGVTYSMAFFSAKHLGAGQYYLMTIRDKDRKPFDGSSTYRLHVPANAPVKLYWSATVYDRATHALIREASRVQAARRTRPACRRTPTVRWTSISAPRRRRARSRTGCRPSADGKFEVLFRLYGPEKPFFDKTWVLPDIERIAAQEERSRR